MFGQKTQATHDEVQKLRKKRDDLEKEAKAVSNEADALTDELLDDYSQAEKQRKLNGGR